MTAKDRVWFDLKNPPCGKRYFSLASTEKKNSANDLLVNNEIWVI